MNDPDTGLPRKLFPTVGHRASLPLERHGIEHEPEALSGAGTRSHTFCAVRLCGQRGVGNLSQVAGFPAGFSTTE